MQIFTMTGNLTADPIINEREYVNKITGEIQKTKVCNFSVACDDGYGDAKKTQFFRINAWHKLGENCALYLKKGYKVTVVGSVHLNNYVKDGAIRSSLEVRAQHVDFPQKPKVVEFDEEEAPY